MPTLLTLFELDGTTIRLHVDKAHGYALTSWTDTGRVYVRETVESRKMDGTAQVNRHKAAVTLQASLLLRAVDMPHNDGLVDALEQATDTPFLLARASNAGVVTTWRCMEADMTASFAKEDDVAVWRTVALSIPAQPNPTRTGLVMP